jgi:hypothetical protein
MKEFTYQHNIMYRNFECIFYILGNYEFYILIYKWVTNVINVSRFQAVIGKLWAGGSRKNLGWIYPGIKGIQANPNLKSHRFCLQSRRRSMSICHNLVIRKIILRSCQRKFLNPRRREKPSYYRSVKRLNTQQFLSIVR